MPSTFGSRLQRTFDSLGQLCIGIDPSPQLLGEWGLADQASSLVSFGKTVVDATVGKAGIVKPQVAFFERHGSAGFAALEQVGEAARDAGLLVIMDAKRGDIGSTMNGYFDAWLGKSAPFYSDALTLSPYLGFESLLPTLSDAHERGKGVFVLTATSNPEASALQRSRQGSATVASAIWSQLGATNTALDGARLGSFGAVVGATIDPTAFGLNYDLAPTTPILAPGFGAQGAQLNQLERLFGGAANRTIATVSRSVLAGGSILLEQAIDTAIAQLRGQSSGAQDE